MIRLNATTKILQLIATATADVTVTGSDKTSTAYTGFSQETAATVSTQTIGAAPGASTVRDIDHVTIKTTGGANTLTVQIFNSSGSITTQQTSISILTGETLEYTHALGWGVIDVNGSRKEVTTSTFSSLTNTGGTATRVLFYGTNGLHSDDAGFTFNTTGDILTVGAINVAGTTAPTVGLYNPSGTLLRTPNAMTVDGNLTATGNGIFNAAAAAAAGSVEITSGDPTLRMKWTDTPVVDQNTFEVRTVGAASNTYLQFRTINDAESVFTSRMLLWNSGGLYLGTALNVDPGAGNATLAGNLTVSGASGLTLSATASPTGTGAGAIGQIAWDTAYIYVCTATNDWRRVALTDF